MRRWVRMTGGLLIWALHFVGIYLISSAADVWSSSEAGSARWIGLAFSMACLLAVIALAVWLGRGRREGSGEEAWERRVGLTGALVAGIGVLWQTAPLAF
ncbi:MULTISPECIES: hypothetical protein [unclassified Brevundimonas]|uniref:hypothetical protein n=1 Tax=unclassified Brevundimonas TaxID=2622653 RepID=UPI000CFC90FF|nr:MULTISPECIES: hypothetical protein [unclassified Brevundimonas]PRA28549.1 hypothetical protein CQ024_09920 [Brevundimonas sp. MYb27]PQZ84072.1 hypothetical protein CQ026_02035 [Brevundimonas sp. MYb31]PRB17955.1 hypothetical protein CQ039_02765 [Brevundimonas sp. MYb52]PRB35935.1 hypothetical protein CQ035_06540 [Brevundimonas sp. MYb46]PRB55893.1 hypothetical protein CQ028_00170 [Brevundimonas sp. MYb33]